MHRIARRSSLAISHALALALGMAPASGQEAAEGAPAAARGYRAGTVQEVGIPLSGVELGMGWDSRRGEVVPNRCIEFAPVQERGQATRLSLHEVADQSELMQTLDVNAAVSVRTIFASGDARASFAKSSKVNASSTNLILRATIDNGVLFVGPKRMPDRARYANPQFGERGEPAPEWAWRYWLEDRGQSDHSITFRPWAGAFLESRDAADFRRHCGDSFVASIQSGAELLALISFTAKDAEEAQHIKASVAVDFGIVAASASAAEANEASRSKTDLEVTVTQIGGSGGPIATSREDLVEKLKLLATDAAKAPKFHSMQVVSYDSLADWPVALPLTATTDALEVIADTYWFLSSYYDRLEEIIADPKAFSYATGLIPSELVDLQDKVLEMRASLRAGLRTAAHGQVPDDTMLMPDGLPVPGGGEADFAFARPGLLGAESGFPTASAWLDALGDSLEADLPFENPNTLLLFLPLPRAATAPVLGDEAALRALAVRRHLHDQAKRFCALDPTDSQCLTNSQLRDLQAKVTVNLNAPPDQQRLQNIGSGLCLYLPFGEEAFITTDCASAEAEAEHGVFDTKNARIRLGATCLLARDDRLGYVAPPCEGEGEGGSVWTFEPNGQIHTDGDDRRCLKSHGADRPVAVVPCAAVDDDTLLTQLWRPLDPD